MKTSKFQLKLHRNSRSGYALVTIVIFLTILSTITAGLGFYATSHNQRATVDSKYAAALDVAEAGINYEYRKISNDNTTADQYPGTVVNVGGGSFKVYCTARDGTTPWSPQQYLYVVSIGTVDGVSRTVKAEAKGFKPDGRYGIYTLNNISVWKGASAQIIGDVGTNGKYQYSADP